MTTDKIRRTNAVLQFLREVDAAARNKQGIGKIARDYGMNSTQNFQGYLRTFGFQIDRRRKCLVDTLFEVPLRTWDERRAFEIIEE